MRSSLGTKFLIATALCLGMTGAANAAIKTVTAPASWGAVKMIVGEKSGTGYVYVFIQRKDTGFCTTSMLGTVSTPAYGSYIVNGSPYDDDMAVYRPELTATRNPNIWTFGPFARSFTNTLNCSNLGSQTILPTPYAYSNNIVLNGLAGSDMVGLTGGANKGTGGDGDDLILSYLTGSGLFIDGGAGNDRIIQDYALDGFGPGPYPTIKAGSGDDCVVNKSSIQAYIDCSPIGLNDWAFTTNAFNVGGLCIHEYTVSFENATGSCWYNGH